MEKKTLLILIVLCAASLELDAQTEKKQAVSPYFSALIVTNIDSAVHWYTTYLPLNVRNRVDNAERGFKQVILENDGMLLELVELKSVLLPSKALESLPQGTRLVGYFKVGFSVADFDTWHQELEKKQVQFYGSTFTDPISGQRSFLVKDPDGNTVQFFEE